MKRAFASLLFASTLLLAALIAYGYGYYLISKKTVAVAELEQSILAKTETASRVSSARAALAEISGDEAAVQAYFVSQEQVVPFIDALQSTGASLGTKVEVLSVSQKPATDHPALGVTLAITGPFDGVFRTAGAIEFAPYDVTVDTFGLSQDAGGTSWRANVTLTVGSTLSTKSGVSPATGTTTPTATP